MADCFTPDQVRELCADIAGMEEITVEFQGHKDMVDNDLFLDHPVQKKQLPPAPVLNAVCETETVSILVDEDGKPITAIIGDDRRGSAEVENAHTIVTHVPVLPRQQSIAKHVPSGPNIKPLKDILLYYTSVASRDKLMKRMPNVLLKLKTKDFRTAKSFIQSDRYADIRKEIALDLEKYVIKDLGMKIAV